MKVTIIVGNFKGGGVQRVFANLANTFADLGVEVSVIRLTQFDDNHLEFKSEIDVIRKNFGRVVTSLFFLIKFFLQKDVSEVVLTGQPHVNAIVIMASLISRSKARVFVSEHNPLFASVTRMDYFIQKVKCYLYRFSKGVVFVSKEIEEEYLSQSSSCGVASKTIRNPVLVPGFTSKVGLDKRFLDAIEDEGGSVILSIGRLHPQKNLLAGIKAVSELVESGEKVKYFVLGEGQERAALESEILARGMGSHIALLGFQKNVYGYLALADLLLLPSRWEGFGVVVVEALSFGVNVVSTDVPGPREILDGGSYGWVVTGGYKELVVGIKSALARPMPREVLIQRSSIYTDVETVAKEYLDFFNVDSNAC